MKAITTARRMKSPSTTTLRRRQRHRWIPFVALLLTVGGRWNDGNASHGTVAAAHGNLFRQRRPDRPVNSEEDTNQRPPRAVQLYESLCRSNIPNAPTEDDDDRAIRLSHDTWNTKHQSNTHPQSEIDLINNQNNKHQNPCVCHFLATMRGPARNQQSLPSVPSAMDCVNGKIDAGTEQYPCSGPVRLLSRVPLTTLSPTKWYTEQANDCWGWYAASGHELVLLGMESVMVVVDVTIPSTPTVLARVAAAGFPTYWKDIKTYGNYAYMVAENVGSGLQVLEMTQLLKVNATQGPVDLEARAFYFNRNGQLLSSAHNLFIHEATGFAYIVGSNLCGAGLAIVNLATNPATPTWEACFDGDGYVHDVQCVLYHGVDTRYTGREICFACNEDTVTIIDVTDKTEMVILSRTGYTNVAYTHQGWLTDDHNVFFFGDELDEVQHNFRTRTFILNVENLEEPRVIAEHEGPEEAIDHNMYIRDNILYQTNYASGLQVYQIGDNIAAVAENLTFTAHFDTYPSLSSARFVGAWSSYIYFPSGNIAISDINRGLFMVQVNLTRHRDDNGGNEDASTTTSVAPSAAPTEAPSMYTGACPRTDACTRRYSPTPEGYYLHRRVMFGRRCVTRCVPERNIAMRLNGPWECGKC